MANYNSDYRLADLDHANSYSFKENHYQVHIRQSFRNAKKYDIIYPFFQPSPRLNGGSKGKGTNDPIRFLPVLPSKRTKPAWDQNPPSFVLSGKIPEEDGKDHIDLVGELTASKYELSNKILKHKIYEKKLL